MTQIGQTSSTPPPHSLYAKAALGGMVTVTLVNFIGYIRMRTLAWRWLAVSIMPALVVTYAIFNRQCSRLPGNRQLPNLGGESSTPVWSNDPEQQRRQAVTRIREEFGNLDTTNRPLQAEFSNVEQGIALLQIGGKQHWQGRRSYMQTMARIESYIARLPGGLDGEAELATIKDDISDALAAAAAVRAVYEQLRAGVDTLGEGLFWDWNDWIGNEETVRLGAAQIPAIENDQVRIFCKLRLSQFLISYLEGYLFHTVNGGNQDSEWEVALIEMSHWLQDDDGSRSSVMANNRLKQLWLNHEMSCGMERLLLECGHTADGATTISNLDLMKLDVASFRVSYLLNQTPQVCTTLLQKLEEDSERRRQPEDTDPGPVHYACCYRDAKLVGNVVNEEEETQPGRLCRVAREDRVDLVLSIPGQVDQFFIHPHENDLLPGNQWVFLVERLIQERRQCIENWYRQIEDQPAVAWQRLLEEDGPDPINYPSGKLFVQKIIDQTLEQDQQYLPQDFSHYISSKELAAWECAQQLISEDCPPGNQLALQVLPQIDQLVQLYQQAPEQHCYRNNLEAAVEALANILKDLAAQEDQLSGPAATASISEFPIQLAIAGSRLSNTSALGELLDQVSQHWGTVEQRLLPMASQMVRDSALTEPSCKVVATLYCLANVYPHECWQTFKDLCEFQFNQLKQATPSNLESLEADGRATAAGTQFWQADSWVKPHSVTLIKAIIATEEEWQEQHGIAPSGLADELLGRLETIAAHQANREWVQNANTLFDLFIAGESVEAAQLRSRQMVKLYSSARMYRDNRIHAANYSQKIDNLLVQATIDLVSAIETLQTTSPPSMCQEEAAKINALRQSAFITAGTFREHPGREQMAAGLTAYHENYERLRELERARIENEWGRVAALLDDFEIEESYAYLTDSREALESYLDSHAITTDQIAEWSHQAESHLESLNLATLDQVKLDQYRELATQLDQTRLLAAYRGAGEQEQSATVQLFVALFKNTPSLGSKLAKFFRTTDNEVSAEMPKATELSAIAAKVRDAGLVDELLGKQIELLRKFAEKQYSPLLTCPITMDRMENPVVAACGSEVPHLFGKTGFEQYMGYKHECPTCREPLEEPYSQPAEELTELLAAFDQLRSEANS